MKPFFTFFFTIGLYSFIAGVLITVAFASSPSVGSGESTKYDQPPSTHFLYDNCTVALKQPDSFAGSFCAGYIHGTIVGMDIGALQVLKAVSGGAREQDRVNMRAQQLTGICFPDHTDPSSSLVARGFVGWVEEHRVVAPQIMQDSADGEFFAALRDIYHCSHGSK